MYYHRRPPRRSVREYFMPFLTILFLVAVIVFAWKGLNALLIEDSKNSSSQRVFLEIEQGSVKAMAADSREWNVVPDEIHLYRGEKIRTGADGRASLTFFNDAVLRADSDSEVDFMTLRRKGAIDTVEAYLPEGDFFAKVPALQDPESRFALRTDRMEVTTRGGVLALAAPATVYMLEGSAQISLLKAEEVVKTFTLGVGQQFMIDDEGTEKLAMDQDTEVIFALSDGFRGSDWYRWNMAKEGIVVDEVTPGSGEKETTPEEKPSGEETAASTPEAPTTSVLDSAAKDEGEIADPTDKTPPPAPIITSPKLTDGRYEVSSVTQAIEGTVSADTAHVIVDDYELMKYVPGSEAFRYVTHIGYDNLKVGENTYKIYAKDRNGNMSLPAVVTLVLSQATYDEGKEKLQSEEAGSAASSSGGVAITEPNGGQNFSTSETEFDIRGVVPAGTAKVVVNDYALSKFQPGDLSFTYKAYKSLGSLEIGRKNTYSVEAFDVEGKKLGEAVIVIDVESQGTPEITIPTTRRSYLTTLDELVIGGSVGKWVQTVYVNDKKLLNYIPGSEKWSHTVVLQPGANTFRVHGRSNSEDTAADTIEITLQP